eukprot:gene12788-15116_t
MAGYVEGALTPELIHNHWSNFYEATFGDDLNGSRYAIASSFVTDNDQYIQKHIQTANLTDPYWYQVQLIWSQLDGLIAGYKAVHDAQRLPPLSRLDFLLLQAMVDLSSLIHRPFMDEKHATWTYDLAKAYMRHTTHCSAMVKVTADFSELWATHNTWTGYFSMLRIAKRYHLPFHAAPIQVDSPSVSAPTSVFSGYPGILASTDDFFVLSSGLVVLETTNAVFNQALLDTITPVCVLTWARSILANRVATDGPSWVEAFKPFNSGTINNQWMIVDYNLFTPGKPLKANTLWILEQLPGFIQAADVTDILRYGYWPSYNRPYFEEVRKRSGSAAMAAKFGDYFTYSLYTRAKIFRRDQGGVRTREQLKQLMRYNDWQHDPFSIDPRSGNRSAELSIAARYDLEPVGPTPFGNTDAKMVGSDDVRKLSMEAICGPTHETQP